jgi:4-diphosphocytidyl-2-C-methyl-D-erythritol kinase
LSTYKYDLGFSIDITKRIPSGAGLGGGSSDAAAVLRIVRDALDPLHNIPPQELAGIGLKLGADVPFFLGGRHAIVRGIGEILEPVQEPRFGGIECLIIVPPVGVPTPIAYKRYRESRPIVPARRPGERSLPALVDSGAIEELIGNDLEEVVTTAYPEVGAALRLVRSSSGAVAGMTGSGSAIFCLPTLGRTFPQGFAGEVRSRLGCSVISTSIVG